MRKFYKKLRNKAVEKYKNDILNFIRGALPKKTLNCGCDNRNCTLKLAEKAGLKS
jgi:hypothetical protein